MRRKLAVMVAALAITFLSPWMHRLAFENVRAALPDTPVEAAHFIAIMLCVFACLVATAVVGLIE